jgi:hypothetical protein
LIQHNLPKSIVYINVPSWCCTQYGFKRLYKVMYPPILYHTEHFHFYRSSVLCLFIFFLPQPLGTTDVFTVSIFLPCPQCWMAAIIQSVAFPNWFLSLSNVDLCGFFLSNMHLMLLHVFLWLDSSFHF